MGIIKYGEINGKFNGRKIVVRVLIEGHYENKFIIEDIWINKKDLKIFFGITDEDFDYVFLQSKRRNEKCQRQLKKWKLEKLIVCSKQ